MSEQEYVMPPWIDTSKNGNCPHITYQRLQSLSNDIKYKCWNNIDHIQYIYYTLTETIRSSIDRDFILYHAADRPTHIYAKAVDEKILIYKDCYGISGYRDGSWWKILNGYIDELIPFIREAVVQYEIEQDKEKQEKIDKENALFKKWMRRDIYNLLK